MFTNHSGRRLAALTTVALGSALFATSCADEAAGPSSSHISYLAIVPSLQAVPAGLVDITLVRVVLTRVVNERVVLDSTVQVAVGTETLSLELRVTIDQPEEDFLLSLQFITPAGQIAFTGGPVTVTATTADGQTTPVSVDVDVVYIGTGADATAVEILSEGATVPVGEMLELEARALGSNEVPIPGTPIGWSTLDPERVQIPDVRVGRIVGGPEQGTARVVAQLLTGPADTVVIRVGTEGPTSLAIISGDNQVAQVGTPLDFPVVLQVLDASQQGVDGILVDFATPDGGQLTPDSAFSDAQGFVQTAWTLGLALGTQIGIASVRTVPELQATFTATAQAAPSAGRDVVVFNDMNIFDNTAMADTNNQRMVRNLVTFSTAGTRDTSSVTWFDRGRNSPCAANRECSDGNNSTMIQQIAAAGLTTTVVNSDTGVFQQSIPGEVKAVFLWNPTVAFTTTEIEVFKSFAAQGGRIVYVGEYLGFYGSSGIATENQFLLDMGAQMTNEGAAIDCGYVVIPESSLRQEHQIMDGMIQVTIACASIIIPGPQDFALFFDRSNTQLLAGVAKVDISAGAPPRFVSEEDRRRAFEQEVRRWDALLQSYGQHAGARASSTGQQH